jgi:hypothetical protein
MPSGPALISPNGTASRGMGSGGYVWSRPAASGVLKPNADAAVLPVSNPAEQRPPRLLQPDSPKPLKPLRGDRPPFQLIKQRDERSAESETIRPTAQLTPLKEAPVLKFEALEQAPPLGTVVSPRKLRQLNKPVTAAPPAPNAGGTSRPLPPAPLGFSPLVRPLKPQTEADPRVKRLPPTGDNPQGLLRRRVLPQQPIPIYPEVPEPGAGSKEVL